ncbi:MAG: type IV secretion IcmS family protein [Pseudomonadota bacterium]
MNLTKFLCALSESLNCKFILRGQAMPMEKLFAENGLLPGLLKKADQLSQFCLGHDLGIRFEDAPGTMLGTKAELNDKISDALRLLCLLDVLMEIIYAAPSRDAVPLDELLN